MSNKSQPISISLTSRFKKESNIILATIYAKSDQADIENNVIESIIKQFEQEN